MTTRIYYWHGIALDITELPPNSMLDGSVTWKDFDDPEDSQGLFQQIPTTWGEPTT